MNVYIPCEHCQKRLKVPDSVLGRSVKCPSCGGVFKSDPAKATPAAPKAAPHPTEKAPVAVAPSLGIDEDEDMPKPRKKAVVEDEDEDVRPARKKAAAFDEDDEEAVRPAKKKAAALDEDEDAKPAKKKAAALDEEDEDAITPAKKKAAALDEDEDDRPAKKRRRADEDEEEAEEVEEAEAKPAKRRTPWYVLLPLVVLSLSAVGLAPLWAYGFAYAHMERTMEIDFDKAMWIGIGAAAGVTLLCLIFSLLPMRAWLRFLVVFLFLLLGYGGTFGVMFWSNNEYEAKQKKAEAPAPLVVPAFSGSGATAA